MSISHILVWTLVLLFLRIYLLTYFYLRGRIMKERQWREIFHDRNLVWEPYWNCHEQNYLCQRFLFFGFLVFVCFFHKIGSPYLFERQSKSKIVTCFFTFQMLAAAGVQPGWSQGQELRVFHVCNRDASVWAIICCLVEWTLEFKVIFEKKFCIIGAVV